MFNELIKAAKDIKDKIVAIRDDVYPVKTWFDNYIETGNLVPPKDDNYDLGSKDRQWRKIYGGTIAADVSLNQVPVMDDAHVPDLETLSYGGPFNVDQIPGLPGSKITSGTIEAPVTVADSAIPDVETLSYGGPFNVDQIPGLPGSKITSGTISAAVDVVDGAIPNVETLSYGGAFALAQIPGIPNSKLDNSAVTITTGNALSGLGALALGDSGTIDVVEGGIDISNLTGTALDAQIPDVDTLSYGGPFNVDQIPGLPGSKITSGTLSTTVNVPDQSIPDVETLSYGGVFALAQIPGIPNSKLDNSAVTITTGNALSGLGALALGDSGTIDVVESGISHDNISGVSPTDHHTLPKTVNQKIIGLGAGNTSTIWRATLPTGKALKVIDAGIRATYTGTTTTTTDVNIEVYNQSAGSTVYSNNASYDDGTYSSPLATSATGIDVEVRMNNTSTTDSYDCWGWVTFVVE